MLNGRLKGVVECESCTSQGNRPIRIGFSCKLCCISRVLVLLSKTILKVKCCCNSHVYKTYNASYSYLRQFWQGNEPNSNMWFQPTSTRKRVLSLKDQDREMSETESQAIVSEDNPSTFVTNGSV